MIGTLLLFGATGDLAGRFLLPALAALAAAEKLPAGFEVVGCAREDWDDDRFRRHAAERLGQHAGDVPPPARDAVLRALGYRSVDAGDADAVARATGRVASPLAAYIALPASLFPAAVGALKAAALPAGSRVVLEKPFGESLDSAKALNRLVADAFGGAAQRVVYRVDHVLGMATVQRLIAMRQGSRLFDAVWDSRHIEQVDILWEETLGLEGRAGFFDQTGTLKDVVQNHMMQLLSLFAMEPPGRAGELSAHKRDVLRAIPSMPGAEVAPLTGRARYTAGRLADGRRVPDYAEEDGVDARRETETFAQVLLRIDNPRWTGTRFLLRAGKALSGRRKGIIFRFRPGTHAGDSDGGSAAPDELRIGIDGPETIELRLAGAARGGAEQSSPTVLEAEPPANGVGAYGNVLFDILSGSSALSVGGEEAEEAWRILDPVLRLWSERRVPLQHYAAGSDGPAPLALAGTA